MPRNLITSDAAIRAVKLGDSRRRLSDGDGLYLLLFVKGGSHGWRFDYTHQGKRKTISLGTYPDVPLSGARAAADACRQMVATGKDPSASRQAKKASHKQAIEHQRIVSEGGAAPGTFKADALAWIAHNSAKWSERTRGMVERQFEADAFPAIGGRPMSSLTALDVLEVVKGVESRGAGEQSFRLLQRIKAVFRFAVIHTRSISTNVTRDLESGEVLKPRVVRHRAALPESELPRFWRELDNYKGDPTTVNALLLLLYTVPRPGELRYTPWDELPPKVAQWRIPAGRMKMPTEHVIPLSRQAKEVIERQRKLTGHDSLVFASPFYPGKPISDSTLNSALARMGYKGAATAHGFRGLFSTVCNEHDKDPDVIELCLAHVERDGVRAAYNAARKLKQRAELLQWWADYVDSKHLATPPGDQ
ncbi:MAG: tyrosine-type recombinase/integrase [Acidobacteriota bacterium]